MAMKSPNSCTILFEDGQKVHYDNVTYSRWTPDDRSFVVQKYNEDETRLETYVYKREHVKMTMRDEIDRPEINLTRISHQP